VAARSAWSCRSPGNSPSRSARWRRTRRRRPACGRFPAARCWQFPRGFSGLQSRRAMGFASSFQVGAVTRCAVRLVQGFCRPVGIIFRSHAISFGVHVEESRFGIERRPAPFPAAVVARKYDRAVETGRGEHPDAGPGVAPEDRERGVVRLRSPRACSSLRGVAPWRVTTVGRP